MASAHPRGSSAVFTGDRGQSVEAMAIAFERWIVRQRDIGGIISAGGSGGTSLATAGMRRLPLAIPKVMISTVASGDVGRYVGPADILMMHSVADVQGLNSITQQILLNGAHALAGMIARMPDCGRPRAATKLEAKPALGITMFGVTTPCVQALTAELEADYDCLVFHATGIGGRSMEHLADSGMLAGAIDVTTTEVADLIVGGVFPATEDRFGCFTRQPIPYVGSCGALDMVNFGPRDTVPQKFRGRNFVVHNPNVTLMRTTRDENARDRRLDRRAAQPDAGAGAVPDPRRRRVAARRAGQAVPRSGGRQRALRDDREERRADRPAAGHPRAGRHQRAAVRGRSGERVPQYCSAVAEKGLEDRHLPRTPRRRRRGSGGKSMSNQILGQIILWLIVLAILVVIAAYLLRWLYRRSTMETAFVRTGFGGEKVVINGGAFVIPVLHEMTPVNMNVMRIEVRRGEANALITRDRMRIDLIAEFFLRVQPTRESVSIAAQTLGRRTMHPEGIRDLFEGKFASALAPGRRRDVAGGDPRKARALHGARPRAGGRSARL